MTTTIMIHNCQNIETTGVHYSNSNAVTMKIETNGHNYSITMFDLPTHIAERLDRAFNGYSSALTEEEIRADERRKIAAKMGL